ncbi:MAG: AbrB family transcriptional regulator [Acidobacteria bacterium]|nr:MAG: AbrB family transcriptional regulator [Acidobacteriota bacterium]
MPIVTVTSKGQVTVPKAIRERLDINEGDKLEFSIDEEGRIVVRSQRGGVGVSGILSDFAPDEPVTAEAMNRAVRRRAAKKARRGSR